MLAEPRHTWLERYDLLPVRAPRRPSIPADKRVDKVERVQDAIGRKWQCSTIQLDFNLPQRFGMQYIDSENVKQQPIMIHRAILGSIERFFGILTENFAGAFPAWLAPVQCRVLPVNAACEDYCQELKQTLLNAGVRVEMVRVRAHRSLRCHPFCALLPALLLCNALCQLQPAAWASRRRTSCRSVLHAGGG